MEPVAAQACCIRAQDNTGVLGRPHPRIAAVCCLVCTTECLALLPQPRGMVHPPWHHLPVHDETDVVGRMQGFVVRAPCGRGVRRCACQWDHPVSVRAHESSCGVRDFPGRHRGLPAAYRSAIGSGPPSAGDGELGIRWSRFVVRVKKHSRCSSAATRLNTLAAPSTRSPVGTTSRCHRRPGKIRMPTRQSYAFPLMFYPIWSSHAG